MVIIFEGFENTGKTEISVALSKALNIPRYKCPTEKGAFNNTYNPEYSLIYETRKFIEFLEQGIIKNVILDRDYPSEYAYGPIFRKYTYDDLEIDQYITEYDRRLYPHNVTIVFCYKPKYKEYYDEVVDVSYKGEVENRYREFITKTNNQVIMLDTSDENIENQIKYITDKLADRLLLNGLNVSIACDYLPPTDDKKVYGTIRFPGIFYGNEVLFIAQNPGVPQDSDKDGIEVHTYNKFHNIEKGRRDFYSEFELRHHESYFKCKMYEFLCKIGKEKYGLLNKQWSFTNAVKYSTKSNAVPTMTDLDRHILQTQINHLKPKKIVSLGRFAHNAVQSLENIQDIVRESYYHPSYNNYSSLKPLT